LRQRVDASDLVQEAHMEAARRLPAYLGEGRMPFKLWLRQIAYDRVLMGRRRHVEASKRALGREMAIPDETSLQLAHRLMALGPSPSQAVMQGELAGRVRDALALLNDTDREVLVMRLLEGLANSEIAIALQLEPATVSKRYGRALLRLRAMLNGTDSK
jgi:RNA polymerase sigma-70 factor (ECF subfamily)